MIRRIVDSDNIAAGGLHPGAVDVRGLAMQSRIPQPIHAETLRFLSQHPSNPGKIAAITGVIKR